MMKKLLLILAGILFSIQGFSQNGKIYGIVQTSNYNLSFCRFDSASGITTKMDSISGISGVVVPTNLIDPVHSIYYFQGVNKSDSEYYLYSFDLATGHFIKQEKTNNAYGIMQPAYDSKKQTIYGLMEINKINNGFSRMDLVKDSVVLIDTVPNLMGNYAGNYGIIEGADEYFMEGIDRNKKSYLYLLDINSGKLKSKIRMNDTLQLDAIKYSKKRNLYYVLFYYKTTHYIASLDTSSGIHILDSIPGMNGYYSFTADYDEMNNRFLLKGIESHSKKAFLYGIDCSNGKIVTKSFMDLNSPYIYNLLPSSDRLLMGTINTHIGASLKNSKAYLCSYNATDTIVNVLDSTLTDTNGFYHFLTTDTAVYVLAFPDFSTYPHELPTWADSGSDFTLANKIHLDSATTIKNFNTLYGSNPGGGGFIGGKVYYCALCKTYGSGIPAAGIRIILADENGKAQEYTYTDKNGQFKFKNLAIAKYKIRVDLPKMDNANAPVVTLTDSINTLDKLGFTLYPTYLSLTTMNGIESAAISSNEFRVYPNPFSEQLNIVYSLPNHGKITVKLMDMMGRTLLSKETLNGSAGVNNIQLNAYTIHNGTYIIQLISADEVMMQKVIKTGE